MVNYLFNLSWYIKRIICLFRGYVIPFIRSRKGLIFIEPLCEFKNPHWINLKGKNLIQRGVIIWADSPGSIVIGEGTSISRFTIIQSAGGHISIGDRSQVGDFCNLYGQGGLFIGNDVMIASCVQIVPNNHTYSDLTKTIKDNIEISKGIIIEDDVWIGTNVVILDGVHIGKGSIIAAGAVVNKNVEPFSIVAGVPSRKIKSRIPEKVINN